MNAPNVQAHLCVDMMDWFSDGGRQSVLRVGVHVHSEFLAHVLLSADRLVLTSIAQRLVTDIVQTPTHS